MARTFLIYSPVQLSWHDDELISKPVASQLLVHRIHRSHRAQRVRDEGRVQDVYTPDPWTEPDVESV